jgi:hypothetical protein
VPLRSGDEDPPVTLLSRNPAALVTQGEAGAADLAGVLTRLQPHGVEFQAVGDGLLVRAKGGTLDRGDLELLDAFRPLIVPHLKGTPDMEIGLRDSIISCVVLAADLLAVLEPDVDRVDPDDLLAHPIAGFSPTAVSHRLRRELRRRFGSAAPTITNAKFTLRFEKDRGETLTNDVELTVDERVWVVSGVGGDPKDAFRELSAAAIKSVTE